MEELTNKIIASIEDVLNEYIDRHDRYKGNIFYIANIFESICEHISTNKIPDIATFIRIIGVYNDSVDLVNVQYIIKSLTADGITTRVNNVIIDILTEIRLFIIAFNKCKNVTDDAIDRKHIRCMKTLINNYKIDERVNNAIILYIKNNETKYCPMCCPTNSRSFQRSRTPIRSRSSSPY